MSARRKEQAAPADVVEIDMTVIADEAGAPDSSSSSSASGADSAASRLPQEDEICADAPLTARVEAVLISTERPLTESRIAEVLGIRGKGSAKRIAAAIEELNGQYERSGRAFRAERLAGGWQILTLASLGPVLNRMHAERQLSRLSQPALETLAIIAYRQPVMRAEVEAIRGVASGEVLRGLLERRLVKIVGRAEELGRPMLYGTTAEFLKVFGLSGVDDLPAVKGLTPKPLASAEARKAAATPDSNASDMTEPGQAAAEPDASASS